MRMAVLPTGKPNLPVLPDTGSPCFSESTSSLSSTHTSVGWTVGPGVEWKFSPVWSVKAEYLYAELGSQDNTIRYTYGPTPGPALHGPRAGALPAGSMRSAARP